MPALREKEEQLKKDQLDGIDSYVAGTADLNFMFDRYMSTKSELRVSTRANYLEVYDRYIRNEFGRKKIGEIKYSDILFFYNHLICDLGLHIGTVQYIQRLIRPALEIAVRDNIIRANPANGVIQQLNKKTQSGGSYVRHALTLEQQREFLSYLDEMPEYNKWVINMPKTESGVRVIPMVDTVYAAFIEEKARQEEEGTFSLEQVFNQMKLF